MRIIIVVFLLWGSVCSAYTDAVSLAGWWNCRLDPNGQGVGEQWYRNLHINGQTCLKIVLPGTTDEAGYGRWNSEAPIDRLARPIYWNGKAWYQKQINIPCGWEGKRIVLFLERTKQSRVWLDENNCGTQDSLCTPHLYDLSRFASAGLHLLTICVDNSANPPLGPAHHLSESTQTNWNGIVGQIQLQVSDKIWIEDIQVYPDVSAAVAKIQIYIGNMTGTAADCEIFARAESIDSKHKVKTVKSFRITDDNNVVYVELPMRGQNMRLWDEFSKDLYRLEIELKAQLCGSKAVGSMTDRKSLNFGMRQFQAKGTQFAVNGRTAFLRGKVDSCVFPLTGYPPMDKDKWRRVFRIAKNYGINHYRFHSWCPPEAAFAAADEMGIYLQAELPNWASFAENKLHDEYLYIEAERIIKSYGNHPSFVMFSLGNELAVNPESRKIMAQMVNKLHNLDGRHLYAEGSNNSWDATSCGINDDFWVTMTIGDWERERRFLRGSFHKHTNGHINNESPSTMTDYTNSIAGVDVPVVSHEIGQYQVFPNYNEIPKYTGVLKARNFEVFRQRLASAGMIKQANDFRRASGALAVICYREEIEAALRTKGLAGFQLLDLQDYPGQGTALVGILDAFMDSKGLIKHNQWRQFCSEVVPLVRMKNYTWVTNEAFTANVQVANYGKNPICSETVEWQLKGDKTIASGKFSADIINQGCLTDIGKIETNFNRIKVPAKLILEVKLQKAKAVNYYPIWVYPADVDMNVMLSSNIKIHRRLTHSVFEELKKGGTILLIPDANKIEHCIPGAFQSDFWCYPMFKSFNPPGTLGILCNSNHPVFKEFPTEFHSDWQWWHLVKNSCSVVLDHMPADLQILVQTIDNFERNHKLGLIFEAKAGQGRLLVCGTDLISLQDKPEAKQLLYSLLSYMESNKFAPKAELTEQNLTQAGLLVKESQ